MNNTAQKINFNTEYWKNELTKLINNSKNEGEKIALKCFEKALNPYFNEPDKLKTLLGKIASPNISFNN